MIAMSFCGACGNHGCKLTPYECLLDLYRQNIDELDRLSAENEYMARELTARGLGWVVEAAERQAR